MPSPSNNDTRHVVPGLLKGRMVTGCEGSRICTIWPGMYRFIWSEVGGWALPVSSPRTRETQCFAARVPFADDFDVWLMDGRHVGGVMVRCPQGFRAQAVLSDHSKTAPLK